MKGRNCLLFIIITELIILIGLSGYRIYEAVDKVVDDNEINNNVGNKQDKFVEHNFDKIEECIDERCSNVKYIRDLEKNLKINYKSENINIEITINYDDMTKNYIKVNNNIIKTGYEHLAARVFKFNENIIIDFDNYGAQITSQSILIIDKNGRLIDTIGDNKTLQYPNMFVINFFNDKNEIVVEQFKTMTAYMEIKRKDIYKIDGATLELIDSNFHDNKIFVYIAPPGFYASQLKMDNVLYTYNCVTNNCKAFGASSNNILIYDDGYYVYDYENDTKKLISYKEINGSLEYMLDNNMLQTERIIFYNEDEEMYYVYDENGDFITKMNNEPYKFTIDNKTYYFTDTFVSKEKGSTVEVYNNEFKKLWIITGLSKNKNYVINSNNTITFNAEIDGTYVLFDSDMNLIHESKTYEMVGITENYIAVIDKNKLKILDLNEFVVAEFDYLPNAYKFNNFYADDSSGNITISAHDYENDKYVYYYYNLNTGEKSIKK